MAISIYMLSKQLETTEFKKHFEKDANDICQDFYEAQLENVESLQELAENYMKLVEVDDFIIRNGTVNLKDDVQRFPSITLLNYSDEVESIFHRSRQAQSIFMAPWIENRADQSRWEKYATDHREEAEIYHMYNNKARKHNLPIKNFRPISDGIFRLTKSGDFEHDVGNRPKLPIWQIADAKERRHTNLWNLKSIEGMQNVLNRTVLQYGLPQPSPFLEPYVSQFIMHDQQQEGEGGKESSMNDEGERKDEQPLSFLFYPLLQHEKIVGVTGMEIDWSRTWGHWHQQRHSSEEDKEIMDQWRRHEEEEGIDSSHSSLRIVLENTCQPNRAVTFQVTIGNHYQYFRGETTGEESTSLDEDQHLDRDYVINRERRRPEVVTYVGSGYHYDKKFRKMAYPSAKLNHLDYYEEQFLHDRQHYDQLRVQQQKNKTANPSAMTNNSLTLCAYEITVYPSSEYEAVFRTWYPLRYVFITVGISLLMISLFIIYDLLLEQRQAGILANAARSDAIVKSLFPDVVRDRLFGVVGSDEYNSSVPFGSSNGLQRQNSNLFNPTPSNNDFAPPQTARSRLGKFLQKVNNSSNKKTWNEDEDEPIAEMFANTTVMFADIAGFTAWSSEREPRMVFKLLETLYHEFDLIAEQLNVFKVETIGDCYVAVSGLPEPQKHHAKIMARFASRILAATTNLTRELDSVLGPGTSDLGLRVGLHSGAVTAGVLRGTKSRFQLFGDTINTASRMESTGMPGKIHVSETTADFILKAGKEHWLRPRENTVAVKGKGEMKTHWVEVRSRSNPIDPQPVGTTTVVGSLRSCKDDEADNSSASASENSESTFASLYSDSDANDPNSASTTPTTVQNNGRPLFPTPKNELIVSAVPDPSPPPPTFSEKGSRPNSWNVWEGVPIGNTTNDGSVTSRTSLTSKESCLIRWNVDILLELLEKVVQHRSVMSQQKPSCQSVGELPFVDAGYETGCNSDVMLGPLTNSNLLSGHLGGPIDEVVEVITLPKFCGSCFNRANKNKQPFLSTEVRNQVKEFVIKIASTYRDVPFHNFEHASHVTMSVYKLIKRIITPSEQDKSNINSMPNDLDESTSRNRQKQREQNFHREAHLATFGISSDPLTQFAVVFAALIHDVDHTGLSNQQLIQDDSMISKLFHGKSVAEQNSVVLSWETLMEPQFKEFRQCIFPNASDKKRFRQLIVNTVMATDILDPDMLQLRKSRWEKAFNNIDNSYTNVDFNRKATIVIEHIIQASDVAHTMQHWHIFIKWNTLLYRELYAAYKKGYSKKDPTEGWYEGQLKFFDNYVIPLAYKLRECGVFGVSGDEYLNYAKDNRAEWACKGHDETYKMVQKVQNEGFTEQKYLADKSQYLHD